MYLCVCVYVCVYVWVYVWVCAPRPPGGVVGRPVFGGHGQHLVVGLPLVAPFAGGLTGRPHHIPVVLPAGGPTAHVAMLHLDGGEPGGP